MALLALHTYPLTKAGNEDTFTPALFHLLSGANLTRYLFCMLVVRMLGKQNSVKISKQNDMRPWFSTFVLVRFLVASKGKAIESSVRILGPWEVSVFSKLTFVRYEEEWCCLDCNARPPTCL